MITITTKNVRRVYFVADGKTAVQCFFADVLAGRVSRYDLGVIGSWHNDDGEEHPFRIASALCAAGWFTADEVAAMLKAADPDLSFTPDEINAMVKADAWMIEDNTLDAEILD